MFIYLFIADNTDQRKTWYVSPPYILCNVNKLGIATLGIAITFRETYYYWFYKSGPKFDYTAAILLCNPIQWMGAEIHSQIHTTNLYDLYIHATHLMRSKNTSGYFSFYVDNISIKTYST